MPLSSSGKKVMASMQKQYGGKKGKSVFYASINAKKPGSSKWEGSTSLRKGAKEMVISSKKKKKGRKKMYA